MNLLKLKRQPRSSSKLLFLSHFLFLCNLRRPPITLKELYVPLRSRLLISRKLYQLLKIRSSKLSRSSRPQEMVNKEMIFTDLLMEKVPLLASLSSPTISQ
jgi:hypothetical protein